MNPLRIPPFHGLPLGALLDSFPDWFQGLSLGNQVLVGFGLALSLALSILVIIGVIWLVYQVVKAAIVGTVISVYFSIACLVLLFMVMFDHRAAGKAWKKVAADIKWFARKAYRSRQYTGPVPRARSRDCRPGPLRIEVPSTRQEVKEAPRTGRFCTECGLLFTTRMQKVLAVKKSCFCEACGQAFEISDGKIAPVLMAA